MSTDDDIFLAASEPLDRTAEWLAGVLRLEAVGDPELEDVSAIERYTGVVDVRLVGRKDEELQAREARAVFRVRRSTPHDIWRPWVR
jgi:hypothetical protein